MFYLSRFSPKIVFRFLRVVFPLVMVLSIQIVWAAEGAFFTGSDGVPIVPGMEEMPDLGIVFDKPEGRIVEGFASGYLDQADIRSFYGRALPQLGWSVFGEGLFQREGEVLKIEILDGVENSRSILRIILAPSQ